MFTFFLSFSSFSFSFFFFFFLRLLLIETQSQVLKQYPLTDHYLKYCPVSKMEKKKHFDLNSMNASIVGQIIILNADLILLILAILNFFLIIIIIFLLTKGSQPSNIINYHYHQHETIQVKVEIVTRNDKTERLFLTLLHFSVINFKLSVAFMIIIIIIISIIKCSTKWWTHNNNKKKSKTDYIFKK